MARDWLKDFDIIVKRARSDVLACKPLLDEYERCPHEYLLNLGGTEGLRMNYEFAQVTHHLTALDPNLRIAAALCCLQQWRYRVRDIEGLLVEQALNDSDERVRGITLCVLHNLYNLLRKDKHLQDFLCAVFGVHRDVYGYERAIAIEVVRGLLNRVQAVEPQLERARIQTWRAYAGEALDLMLQDEGLAWQYANGNEARLRVVALDVLHEHWGIRDKLASMCETLAVGDTDAEVREVAIGIIAQVYSGSCNERVGRLLASFVKDPGSDAAVRKTAYDALFKIRGLPPETWPSFKPAFVFPDEIDWQFVKTF